MISFDANILVYAVDRDSGDRHRTAAELVERGIRSGICVQPLQTLCEFFNVATRKIGIDPSVAAGFVEDWHMAVRVEPAIWGDLADAMRAVPAHGLAFWDAMLWATVHRIGARLLLTEDFQDGRTIEGVRIVNPFAAHNEAIIARELPKAR